jgi:hypothetical protein
MRGRICVLGWCVALVAIAASVMNLGDAVDVGDFFGFGLADNRRWALAIPLAAGLMALWRPRLAPGDQSVSSAGPSSAGCMRAPADPLPADFKTDDSPIGEESSEGHEICAIPTIR